MTHQERQAILNQVDGNTMTEESQERYSTRECFLCEGTGRRKATRQDVRSYLDMVDYCDDDICFRSKHWNLYERDHQVVCECNR